MPHNWQRICCPVDFSACSRAALDQAVSLAFHTGAEIFLLHAMEPPADTLVTPSGSWTPGVLSQLEQDLTDELARWQQAALEAGADHVASEVIVSPHTLDAIVHYAAQHRCDAFVLGSHGAGNSPQVLGSVAAEVVRKAQVPVVVVNPPARQAG